MPDPPLRVGERERGPGPVGERAPDREVVVHRDRVTLMPMPAKAVGAHPFFTPCSKANPRQPPPLPSTRSSVSALRRRPGAYVPAVRPTADDGTRRCRTGRLRPSHTGPAGVSGSEFSHPGMVLSEVRATRPSMDSPAGGQRSDRKVARISWENSSGCSQAAKWPPGRPVEVDRGADTPVGPGARGGVELVREDGDADGERDALDAKKASCSPSRDGRTTPLCW